MIDRREFCKQLGALGVVASVPQWMNATATVKKEQLIWAYLIHLGYNMWEDYTPEEYKNYSYDFTVEQTAKFGRFFHPELTCHSDVWDLVVKKAADSGVNMIIIDLGDGVKYESHPEIAVKGAWTPEQLRKALKKMRKMGIEPIPKLNFSCGHKAWLHEYQYMISSKPYLQLCSDLINEVIDLFDNPRYFHLGMDEETCADQTLSQYSVVRRGDLWWRDFYYLVSLCEKRNVRSWIWSDNLWRNKDEFLKKMPKTVLQSNWNYEDTTIMFNEKGEPGDVRAQSFIDLEKHGFDQVPAGSLWWKNKWVNYENFDRLVKYNKQIVSKEHLKGFMQTIWLPTMKTALKPHYEALDVVKKVKEKYYR